jgi:hypothetical protein
MSQPSMLSVHLIEPPVANSGIAGGACVIAVAAAAPVAMQGRGEGEEQEKEREKG